MFFKVFSSKILLFKETVSCWQYDQLTERTNQFELQNQSITLSSSQYLVNIDQTISINFLSDVYKCKRFNNTCLESSTS